MLAPLLSCVLLAPAQDAVVVLMDDIARADRLAVPMPNFDALARRGWEFEHAYANPTCSPSRRSMFFGRFEQVEASDECGAAEPDDAQSSETCIARLCPGQSGLFGKWHLGSNPLGGPAALAPIAHGFTTWRAGHFSNVAYCGGSGYFDWDRIDDGVERFESEYEPLAVVEAFEAWWDATPSPKLAVLTPQLAHSPFHAPPAEYLPAGSVPATTPVARYDQMIQAMDFFLGRITRKIGAKDLLIVAGDNGTPGTVAPDPGRAKGSLYERGVNVPMVIVAPQFREQRSTRHPRQRLDQPLVHLVDIYATVADWFDVPLPPRAEGISLLGPRPGHEHVFCGLESIAAVRTEKLKMMRRRAGGGTFHEELYDLVNDPDEQVDLIADPRYLELASILRRELQDYEAR